MCFTFKKKKDLFSMIRIVTSSGVDYVAAFNLNFLNLFQNLFRFELLRDS